MGVLQKNNTTSIREVNICLDGLDCYMHTGRSIWLVNKVIYTREEVAQPNQAIAGKN
jgi:hypothetical protein